MKVSVPYSSDVFVLCLFMLVLFNKAVVYQLFIKKKNTMSLRVTSFNEFGWDQYHIIYGVIYSQKQ